MLARVPLLLLPLLPSLVACGPNRQIDRLAGVVGGGVGGAGGRGGALGTGGRGSAAGAGGVTSGPAGAGSPDGQAGAGGTGEGQGGIPGSDGGEDASGDTEPDARARPTFSDARAASCAEAAPWASGTLYPPGAVVAHGDPRRKFECRPWPNTPWCALPDYEPGLNLFYEDAWIDLGACP